MYTYILQFWLVTNVVVWFFDNYNIIPSGAARITGICTGDTYHRAIVYSPADCCSCRVLTTLKTAVHCRSQGSDQRIVFSKGKTKTIKNWYRFILDICLQNKRIVIRKNHCSVRAESKCVFYILSPETYWLCLCLYFMI